MTYSTSRQFCWDVTITILKKLGSRYAMAKLPSGKLFFVDKKTGEIKRIPNKH